MLWDRPKGAFLKERQNEAMKDLREKATELLSRENQNWSEISAHPMMQKLKAHSKESGGGVYASFEKYHHTVVRMLNVIISQKNDVSQLSWPKLIEPPLPFSLRFVRLADGHVLPSLPLLADEIEHPQKFVDALEAFLNADIPEGNRSI